MKKIREWFQELPDGIRELALRNQVNDGDEESLDGALYSGFVWGNTPEGGDFWVEVRIAAQGNREYPEIPEAVVKKDPIVESVVKSFRERSKVGIKKYGTTLADNPMKLVEWMQYLSEELQDAILYLERMKQELKDGENL